MQTDLLSDDFCGYNQRASPFYWSFQPGQYENTFAYGEVGVPVAGGTAGSYVRPDIVDSESFLSGRDNILSRCVPPAPSLDSLNQPPLHEQDRDNTNVLLPKYTREKRSSNDLDSVDYNRWQPGLAYNPQNLRLVIEGFNNQRGGFNTRNYTKLAWKPGSFAYPDKNASQNFNDSVGGSAGICQTTLRPGLTSDSSITGYPGQDFITGQTPNVKYQKPGIPYEGYPFVGITSQQVVSVGADDCGPQFFENWPDNTKGQCPVIQPDVLQNNALGPDEFSVVPGLSV